MKKNNTNLDSKDVKANGTVARASFPLPEALLLLLLRGDSKVTGSHLDAVVTKGRSEASEDRSGNRELPRPKSMTGVWEGAKSGNEMGKNNQKYVCAKKRRRTSEIALKCSFVHETEVTR